VFLACVFVGFFVFYLCVFYPFTYTFSRNLTCLFSRGFTHLPDDGKCFAETSYIRIIMFSLFQQLLTDGVQTYFTFISIELTFKVVKVVDVYTMVLHNHGALLYSGFKEEVREPLRSKVHCVSSLFILQLLKFSQQFRFGQMCRVQWTTISWRRSTRPLDQHGHDPRYLHVHGDPWNLNYIATWLLLPMTSRCFIWVWNCSTWSWLRSLAKL